MTNTPDITPPPELVQQWDDEGTAMFRPEYQMHLATRAAQWGADQELEACCEWLNRVGYFVVGGELRAARRPKPPSLKEQALSSLTRLVVDLDRANMRDQATILEGPIRRALEALDD